jgi:dTDP-4-dehydrorhamnose 3,5-epimerase
MRVTPLDIPDVLLIEPRVFSDDRGFFLESYEARRYAEHGIPTTLVQDNHSGSHRGVLRGLHYQLGRPQGKLVSVLVGEIFDVAVDLRRLSPTFGQWAGVRVSAESHQQLWIPPGFAHGFYVLSPWAEVTYKVDDFYYPQGERTLRWDDPAVGVQWPIIAGTVPLLSVKDYRGALLSKAEIFDEAQDAFTMRAPGPAATAVTSTSIPKA